MATFPAPPQYATFLTEKGDVEQPWLDWFIKLQQYITATGAFGGGILPVASGGTGFASYTTGDILYAASALSLGKLNDVPTGSAVISGGVGVIPSYGKIGLTTHVSGVLPPANGGTGVNNGTSTITVGGNAALSGAFTFTGTLTGNTGVTFPTSGTLITSASLPVGANPTASVGLTAVNGTALTFTRSDGAPALSEAIAPSWTSAHRFTRNPSGTLADAGNLLLANTRPTIFMVENDQAADEQAWCVDTSAKLFRIRTFSDDSSIARDVLRGTRGAGAELSDIRIGDTSSNNTVTFPGTGAARLLVDNKELQLGAGTDLRLYHDGTNSVIENDTGDLSIKTGGNLLVSEGQLAIQTVGKGLSVKEGSNAKMGQSTLVAGTVTVSTTAVTATSRIMLTVNGGTLTNLGVHYVSARTAGTSFVISSSNILDASDIAWILFEPA